MTPKVYQRFHFTDDSGLDLLAQVGGLIFLVVYVIATNRIAQANQTAAKATEESAHAAQQAVEAALRSLQVSEAMLAEAKATRTAQEMQTAPRVVVYAEIEGLIRYLAIENTGLSFANDVTITFAPPLPYNAFLSDSTPDFFTGSVFTLKPGEKIRQPLSQNYRPTMSFTGKMSQTATARYRGGVLTDETVETFPINLSGFENILVAKSDAEQAIEKLEDLVKAVEQTGEAVKTVATRLDDGIHVSTTLLMPQGDMGIEAKKDYFHRLAIGLSDEWRIWQDMSEVQYYMRRPMRRRFQQLMAAVFAIVAYVPMPDDDARRVRALLFDIQASLDYPYIDRDIDEVGIITCSLDELVQIAKRQSSSNANSSDSQATADALSNTGDARAVGDKDTEDRQ